MLYLLVPLPIIDLSKTKLFIQCQIPTVPHGCNSLPSGSHEPQLGSFSLHRPIIILMKLLVLMIIWELVINTVIPTVSAINRIPSTVPHGCNFPRSGSHGRSLGSADRTRPPPPLLPRPHRPPPRWRHRRDCKWISIKWCHVPLFSHLAATR